MEIETASRDALIDAVLSTVRERRPVLVRELANMETRLTLALLDSVDGYSRVCAAQMLSRLLVDLDGDTVGGARLHRGLIDIVLAWNRTEALWATTVQTLLTSFAALAVDAGMGREIYEHAPSWLQILEELGDPGYVSDLRLKQVEALINDGYYERALKLLDRESTSALRADLVPVHNRLRQKIEGILKRPDQEKEIFDGEMVIRLTLEYLRRNPLDAALTQVLEANAPATLDQGMFSRPAFPAIPKSLELLRKRAGDLPKSRSPLMSLQAVLQGAGAMLQSPDNDSVRYRLIAEVAEQAESAAQVFGYWENSIDASWIVIVAYRRAGDYPQALQRALMVTARIDQRRQMIVEPTLRAGVAIYLAHLPWCLTDAAIQTGDSAAVLYGMEIAKGRILGDIRLRETAVSSSPESLLGQVRNCLNGKARVHILSFLADTTADPTQVGEVGIRALLLTNDGAIRWQDIKLSEASIQAVADKIDELVRGLGVLRPPNLGDIFSGDPWRRPFDPYLEILAPLVAWLEPLLEPNVLRKGDTIAYAADGSIHNIPLGMLPFLGEPFIETFSLVAMPSLISALGSTGAVRPNGALAFLGPRDSEKRSGETYRQEFQALAALLPTTAVSAIEEARAALSAPQGKLLHFAMHGIFDEHSPLKAGGLAMQTRSGFYDEDNRACILSPEDLSRYDLNGVHLTMRACLVGRVKEITSREALGVVWSILSAGAATLVAASWTVSIGSAARWCDYFYEAWLEKGQSRAEAHRSACRALRSESKEFAHPCHWAPFVLYAGTFEGDVL